MARYSIILHLHEWSVDLKVNISRMKHLQNQATSNSVFAVLFYGSLFRCCSFVHRYIIIHLYDLESSQNNLHFFSCCTAVRWRVRKRFPGYMKKASFGWCCWSLAKLNLVASTSPWKTCGLMLTLLLSPFPEQQDSMATTVAVSPSEYLQPSTASSQVSHGHSCLSPVSQTFSHQGPLKP